MASVMQPVRKWWTRRPTWLRFGAMDAQAGFAVESKTVMTRGAVTHNGPSVIPEIIG